MDGFIDTSTYNVCPGEPRQAVNKQLMTQVVVTQWHWGKIAAILYLRHE